MKFFPYESWIVESPLDVQTLVKEISRRVEPRKLFGFGRREVAPLAGQIDETGFTINRIIHYRNSFLPIIYGCFMPKDKGTVIRIHMTLHPITYILIVPIVGLLSIFSLALIASGFDDATWGMLGVLGVCFAFYWR